MLYRVNFLRDAARDIMRDIMSMCAIAYGGEWLPGGTVASTQGTGGAIQSARVEPRTPIQAPVQDEDWDELLYMLDLEDAAESNRSVVPPYRGRGDFIREEEERGALDLFSMVNMHRHSRQPPEAHGEGTQAQENAATPAIPRVKKGKKSPALAVDGTQPYFLQPDSIQQISTESFLRADRLEAGK
ncbi:MAG: hypothetical protein ACTJLL_01930 [Anaplasma sp.]